VEVEVWRCVKERRWGRRGWGKGGGGEVGRVGRMGNVVMHGPSEDQLPRLLF
jgi:hypothetical protein